jgi:hypothetical protein
MQPFLVHQVRRGVYQYFTPLNTGSLAVKKYNDGQIATPVHVEYFGGMFFVDTLEFGRIEINRCEEITFVEEENN